MEAKRRKHSADRLWRGAGGLERGSLRSILFWFLFGIVCLAHHFTVVTITTLGCFDHENEFLINDDQNKTDQYLSQMSVFPTLVAHRSRVPLFVNRPVKNVLCYD